MTSKCVFRVTYPLTRALIGSVRRSPHQTSVTRALATAAPESSTNADLIIDDSAVKQLSRVCESGAFLRLSVEGGGCSGFQYKFDLDSQTTQEDEVFEKAGTKVVVDRISLDLIKGSTIVFEDTLMSSAFQVMKNPQADSGCSCGVSFSLKL